METTKTNLGLEKLGLKKEEPEQEAEVLTKEVYPNFTGDGELIAYCDERKGIKLTLHSRMFDVNSLMNQALQFLKIVDTKVTDVCPSYIG